MGKPVVAVPVACVVTLCTATVLAAAPANIEVRRDVAFLPEGRKEKLDLYVPKDIPAGEKRPCVIFIHGGAWAIGDKADKHSQDISRVLAAEGYVCASINYKLAPKGGNNFLLNVQQSFPQNIRDCKSAVRFLRKNADKYAIDPDGIGVMDISAGAHLAALVAYADPKDGLEPEDEHGDVSPAVQAFVGFYGVYDWQPLAAVLLVTDEARTLAARAAPVTYVDKKGPPGYLIHGTKDGLVHHSQSQIMADRLEGVGVERELVIVKDAPHGFGLNLKTHDVKGDVRVFLKKHLGGQ